MSITFYFDDRTIFYNYFIDTSLRFKLSAVIQDRFIELIEFPAHTPNYEKLEKMTLIVPHLNECTFEVYEQRNGNEIYYECTTHDLDDNEPINGDD